MKALLDHFFLFATVFSNKKKLAIYSSECEVIQKKMFHIKSYRQDSLFASSPSV